MLKNDRYAKDEKDYFDNFAVIFKGEAGVTFVQSKHHKYLLKENKK